MASEVLVTKIVHFDAAHFLYNSKWTREENIAKFHKCSKFKPDGSEEPHGHTYTVEVSVGGYVDEDTGFVIDFKELKKIIEEKIMEQLDHRLINNIPYFNDKLATAENIVQFIWQQLQLEINTPGRRLWKIKLYETPDSYVEYDGML